MTEQLVCAFCKAPISAEGGPGIEPHVCRDEDVVEHQSLGPHKLTREELVANYGAVELQQSTRHRAHCNVCDWSGSWHAGPALAEFDQSRHRHN